MMVFLARAAALPLLALVAVLTLIGLIVVFLLDACERAVNTVAVAKGGW